MDAARERFGRDGYRARSLVAVAADAGVTKGSLYHHFRSKRDLFEAVFEAESSRLSQGVAEEALQKQEPWEIAYAGIAAFLRRSQEPVPLQIIINDAMNTLGWERARDIEARTGLGTIKAVLVVLADAGEIGDHDVDALAHLFLAALAESAHLIAGSDDPATARRRVERELRALLEGLRP